MLDVMWLPDSKGFENAASDPDLDLILVDYSLPGLMGDQIVRKIRERDIYVDIIFYSQQQNPKDKAPNQDGVFYRERGDVDDAIRQLFDVAIRRTHHINIMRGLVISEAIDIENKLSEAMASFLGPRGSFYLENVLRGKGVPIYDFQKKVTVVQRMLNELIADANRAKDVDRVNRLKGLKDVFSTIDAEVMDVRNILAHAERDLKDGKVFYLEGLNNRTKSLTCTKDWCQKARKDLLKHAENVEKIKGELAQQSLPAALTGDALPKQEGS